MTTDTAARRARILFVAPRFHTNQVPVVRALLEHGHPVRFLAHYVGAVESHAVLKPDVVPFRPAFLGGQRMLERTRRQIPRFRLLWRYLRDYSPDLTIIRDFGSPTDLVVLAYLLACRKRFLLYTQGAKYRQGFTWRQRLPARVFVRWLGGGWFTPVLYREGPQPDTLEELDFLPLVWEPDPSLIKEWSPVDSTQPVRLLSIGKFAPYKEHPLVLRAVAHPSLRDRVRLTIIGECSTPEHEAERARCRALVAELGLGDRVEFRASVPYEALQAEYRHHDLLVVGSRRETFGMVVLEAMGCGLPPVWGDGNGSACYVDHGVSGFIYRSGDLDSLVQVLRTAVDGRDRLPEVGRQAVEALRRRCSGGAWYAALQELARRRLSLTL